MGGIVRVLYYFFFLFARELVTVSKVSRSAQAAANQPRRKPHTDLDPKRGNHVDKDRSSSKLHAQEFAVVISAAEKYTLSRCVGRVDRYRTLSQRWIHTCPPVPA